jgi:hypothetical protein
MDSKKTYGATPENQSLTRECIMMVSALATLLHPHLRHLYASWVSLTVQIQELFNMTEATAA